MQHLGDITKINGANVPEVDCIIGGSPCQDLSVAGKREGLAGERSGLFMEQIRIIKEMRQHGRDIGRSAQHVRPRYMVWENVPGAFSSNKGKDFAAVLEETIRIAEPEAPDVPVPEKGWPTSGCLMGDGWSIAWRVLDAQFWGVPQRRRRIALVADFGGLSAPEILFVRKGVSGDIDESKPKGKEAARDAGKGFDGTVPVTLKIRSGCEGGGKGALIQTDKSATLSTLQEQTLFQPVPNLLLDDQGGQQISIRTDGKSPTLRAEMHGNVPAVMCKTYSIENHPADSRVDIDESGKVQTLTSRMGTGGGNVPMVMESKPVYCLQGAGATSQNSQGMGYKEHTSYTLNTTDMHGVAYALETYHCNNEKEIVPTLKARDWKDPNCVCYRQGGFADYVEGEVGTLRAAGGDFGGGSENLIRTQYIVRRLTPLECERLQGFPDGWTDIGEWVDSKGKKHKEADSPRYKALGNSIAIPPWKWVLKRICACYERDATMASLFDGIGGFPYIWEQLNGKGSCLWASEIEEFPIAVTKLRFGGD